MFNKPTHSFNMSTTTMMNTHASAIPSGDRKFDLLKTFLFDNCDYNISFITKDDDILFKASDIGKILGIKNMRQACSDIGSTKVVVLNYRQRILSGMGCLVYSRLKNFKEIIQTILINTKYHSYKGY